MQLDGDQVWDLLYKRRVDREELTKLPFYFAIVYMFVPQGVHQDDVIQSQYDLFYLAGFECVEFKRDNWRGSGILVDFGDLVPVFSSWWHQPYYGRVIKIESERYGLEHLNRKTAPSPSLPGEVEDPSRPGEAEDPSRPGAGPIGAAEVQRAASAANRSQISPHETVMRVAQQQHRSSTDWAARASILEESITGQASASLILGT